jgi:hypothetical protein
MKQQTILTILVAMFPSYVAVVSNSVAAILLLILSSAFLLIATAVAHSNKETDPGLIGYARLAWIIHLSGLMFVIGYYNL